MTRLAQTAVAGIILAAALSSCRHDVADRYYIRGEPARSPESVVVLYERPTVPFDVMADFQARNASETYMREKAAEIGADAVIISRTGGLYDLRETAAGADRQAGTGTSVGHLNATAIRYK